MQIKGCGKLNSFIQRALLVCALSMVPLFSQAASNSGITYHGRILKPSGEPLEAVGVQFKIQLRTPNTSNCLLFQEIKNVDMSGSNGLFSLTINDGNGDILVGSYNLSDVFSNRKTFTVTNPNLDCGGGNTYSPDQFDGRKMVVYFKEPSAADWEKLEPMDINFVPQALQAVQVGGFGADDLLRVERTNPSTQTVSALTFSDYQKLSALLVGAGATTSGQVMSWNGTSWSGITPLTSESDPSVQAFAKAALPTCASGEVLKSNGTALSCVTDVTTGASTDASTTAKGVVQISSTGGISVSAGVISLPDTVTAGSYVRVTTDAKGRVTAGQTTLSDTYLDTVTTAGKVSGSAITSGNISTSGNIATSGTISATGNISSAANITATGALTASSVRLFDGSGNYLTMDAPSMAADYTLTWPSALPLTSKVLQVAPGGALSWVDASAGSVTAVTVNSPLSVTNGTTTPDISIAQATSTTSGYLSSADWQTFNSKITSTLNAGQIFVGNASNVATAVTPSGDVTMTDAGSVTVAKIQGRAVSSTTPTTGQVLRYDSGSWAPNFISMADLRSTITGASALTSCSANQTLTWSSATDNLACSNISGLTGSVFGSQTANSILAAPNGSAGMPAFRSMALADMPAISSGAILSNVTGASAVPAANSLSAILDAATSNAQGSLLYRGSSGWTSLSPGTSGYFLKTQGASADPVWAQAGSGTVTSVGLTMPSIFSVTGSPLTTSGTLAVSLATQSANTFFAGPSGGGTPTFRSIASADLPTAGTAGTYGSATSVPVLTTDAYGRVTAVTNTTITASATSLSGTVPVGSGGTGATTLTAYGMLMGNGTSAVSAVAPAASGAVLTSTGTTSAPSWQTPAITSSTGTAGYVPVYSAATTLADSAIYQSSGNVGIGTTGPTTKLQVNGTISNTVVSFTGVFTCGTSAIDYSQGNFQRLTPSTAIAAGTCNVALSNMVAGSSYTLVVTGNAATNAVTYNFTGYTFKYLPTNVATIAGKDTIYTFLYDGATVYVTWAGGY